MGPEGLVNNQESVGNLGVQGGKLEPPKKEEGTMHSKTKNAAVKTAPAADTAKQITEVKNRGPQLSDDQRGPHSKEDPHGPRTASKGKLKASEQIKDKQSESLHDLKKELTALKQNIAGSLWMMCPVNIARCIDYAKKVKPTEEKALDQCLEDMWTAADKERVEDLTRLLTELEGLCDIAKSSADSPTQADTWESWDDTESEEMNAQFLAAKQSTSTSTTPKISVAGEITEKEKKKLQKEEKKAIKLLFKNSLKEKMKREDRSAIKVSRKETGFSRSYMVTKEGKVFGHVHTKPTEVHLKSGEARQTKPEGKFIGKGGLKVVNALERKGRPSEVIGVLKKGKTATENAIEAAKVFGKNPRVACGSYVTWESKGSAVTKEGFIDKRLKGDLEARVSAGNLKNKEKNKLMMGAAKALREVHKAGWAHRDVKLGNFLVNNLEVKISDFDFAIKAQDIQKDRRIVGTLGYMAPEVMKGPPYDPQKADIFALGLVLYEIHYGTSLTNFASDTMEEVFRTQNLTYEDFEGEGFQKPSANNLLGTLIWEMINPEEPSKRPSIDEVVKRLQKL